MRKDLKPHEIEERHLKRASELCSYWAKKRMLKKLDKVVWKNGKPRSPKDLDEYTTNFVNIQLAKDADEEA